MTTSSLTIQQARFLQQITIFHNLGPSQIQELCQGLKLHRLPRDSMVFSQGDETNSMALLVSGRVEIEKASGPNHQYGLALLEAPCIIGELAYFTGAKRNASARVLDPLEYFEISSDFLFTVSQQNPRGIELFFNEITDRLINNSIHARFSEALGITDPQALKEIIQATQITSIAKGEIFIHQNDLADTMAVVLEGRLLVRKKTSEGDDIFVGRIFPGESVGETGLLSPHRRRNAEVIAQRDSKLGVINIEKFEALLMNRPEVLLTLMRTILERELHQGPSQARRSLELSSAKANHMPSISLLCDDQTQLRPILDLLASDPDVAIIDEPRLNQRFLLTNMSSKAFNTPLETLIKTWIDEEEHQNRLLILVADSSKPRWTRFVQSYCDGAYIFSSHSRDQRRNQKEATLQPDKTPSLRILDHRRGSSFDQVVLPPKVDLSDPKAHEQMFRLLTGRGRGLVLSGGGARGFAHIGVLRALEEFGMEPDSLGGTSMGGLVAATYAIHKDVKIVEDITARFSSRRNILDWTLPISSLTASKKVGKILRSILGENQFSDLSYPLFIIACDIQGSKEIRFTQGYLYDAVRASISIPGIFYPVIRNNQTLVDGGVINNLPRDVMRQRIGKGVVIGSDLGSSTSNRDYRYFQPEGDGMSGLSQVLRTTFAKSYKSKTPGLSDILMKTFEVNTRKKLETTLAPADKLISLDLSHIDPMDFGSYKRIIQEGYDQTLNQLDPIEKL